MDNTRLKELRALVRNVIIDDAGAELARYVLDEFLPYARKNDYQRMDQQVLAKFKEPKQRSQVITIAELIRRYQSTRDVDISGLIKFIENYSSFVAQERKVPGNKPRGRLYETAKKFRLVRNSVVHSSSASLKWTTELSIQEDIAAVGKLLEMIAPGSEVVRCLRLLSREVHEYFAESAPEATEPPPSDVPRGYSPGVPAAEYAHEDDAEEEEPEAEEGGDDARPYPDDAAASTDRPEPAAASAREAVVATPISAALPTNDSARSFRRVAILGGGFILFLFAALFFRGLSSPAPAERPSAVAPASPTELPEQLDPVQVALAVVVLDAPTAEEHRRSIDAYLAALAAGRRVALTACDIRTGAFAVDTVEVPAGVAAMVSSATSRRAEWMAELRAAIESSKAPVALVYVVPANASARRLRSLPSAEVSTPELRAAIAAKGVRVHVLCPDDPGGNEIATAMKTLFPTLSVHRL